MVKLSPHPQVAATFGLLNLNPLFKPSSGEIDFGPSEVFEALLVNNYCYTAGIEDAIIGYFVCQWLLLRT